MAVAAQAPCVVGALSCQKDSYLQSLMTKVVSCEEYVPPKPLEGNGNLKQKKSTDPAKFINESGGPQSKAWLVEFSDSVLFPEGGGQPTDHGVITPLEGDSTEAIPITSLMRHGLRCKAFSPRPLTPGTLVRQDVNFKRRFDHMQQHTGQHLLSAIMDTLSLETLGWAMGKEGEMNYVELPRKPSDEEIHSIQDRCNAAIRENMPITVEIPEDAKADSLPEDYDKERGVVRFIKIGDLDYNACCGTHLKQTSHISVILLHHTQTIRGTNCRLFFTCGERAISMAVTAINGLRAIAMPLSCGSTPPEVLTSVQRLGDNLADTRRREKKLLAEIAKFEGERVKAVLQPNKVAWCYRATDGLDFINLVWTEVKEALKGGGAVVFVSGQVKESGSIMILGEKNLVDGLSAKVKEIVSTVKGGGKGEKWQGKITEWKKGEIEALQKAVEG